MLVLAMPWAHHGSVYTLEIFSCLAYFLPPILSLAILFFLKKGHFWLAVPITIAVDLLVWGAALTHNHGELRGVALVFLVPQIALTALAAWLLSLRDRKHLSSGE